jgi:hypothetical protein
VGFVVYEVALGQVFSEYFGLPANSHSASRSTLIITWGIGQVVADVPTGLSQPNYLHVFRTPGRSVALTVRLGLRRFQ